LVVTKISSRGMPLARTAAPTAHVRAVIALVCERFAAHPGELDERQWWLPTTRAQALAGLHDFLDHRFELFGPYEDALSERDPFLFHSLLSPALNLGLVTPSEVIEHALAAAGRKRVPLASVEGFVRQIIGWREFVRGIYWRPMPGYAERNALDAHRRLSALYWTGDTRRGRLEAVLASGRYIARMSKYSKGCRYDLDTSDRQRRLPVHDPLLELPRSPSRAARRQPADALSVAEPGREGRRRTHADPRAGRGVSRAPRSTKAVSRVTRRSPRRRGFVSDEGCNDGGPCAMSRPPNGTEVARGDPSGDDAGHPGTSNVRPPPARPDHARSPSRLDRRAELPRWRLVAAARRPADALGAADGAHTGAADGGKVGRGAPLTRRNAVSTLADTSTSLIDFAD